MAERDTTLAQASVQRRPAHAEGRRDPAGIPVICGAQLPQGGVGDMPLFSAEAGSRTGQPRIGQRLGAAPATQRITNEGDARMLLARATQISGGAEPAPTGLEK
jgi:hypothetical protein